MSNPDLEGAVERLAYMAFCLDGSADERSRQRVSDIRLILARLKEAGGQADGWKGEAARLRERLEHELELHAATEERAQSAEAELSRMKEGLEPFALDMTEYEDVPDDATVHCLIMGGEELVDLDFRVFRRARQLLTPEPEHGS